MMMRLTCAKALVALSLFGVASAVLAADTTEPVGDPVLDAPTLRSLGVHWIVRGDDNRDATIRMQYRQQGEKDWREGQPLFRVERGHHHPKEQPSLLQVPADGWLFAGSALMLEPDTAYELQLTLTDADGNLSKQETIKARTVGEPVAPANLMVKHVAPGEGGGTGTANDPYRGIAEANKQAVPGTLFLLAPGTYEKKTVKLTTSGEPGKPVIWRGSDQGETIISGGPAPANPDAEISEETPAPKETATPAPGPERAIEAIGLHDVWFENLTIRDANHGIVAHEAGRIVVRRCHFHHVHHAFTATKNRAGNMTGFFITDNVMEGPSTWPRSKGIEDVRGVQVSGAGHVVAYNRIRGFGDAIDTMPSPTTDSIDFHNNDVSELTDDGLETDYSQRNVRVFENRLTNVYQGISTQPVYGGPIYIFRNALYNVAVEPFKLHNSPSGVLILHNTIVKEGHPWELWTTKPVTNIFSRNNLFLGTAANYAFVAESGQPTHCDFDYDGFGGGPFKLFLKWNKQKYATLDEVRAKADVYKHAVLVDPAKAFASGVRPPESEKEQFPNTIDLRLLSQSEAIDAGQPLPGINDGFAGKAPDLGAFELGAPLPHYGPRPVK